MFFPTYNEADNVERLIGKIREFLPESDILVVDDASPDGTGELLDRLSEQLGGIEVIHRPGKLGLGSAHKLAMLHARDRGYDVLVVMDADFSHHPKYLPRFLELLGGGADFVIGSRYMVGGHSDYGWGRTVISRTANLFAKGALGLPLEETTTMYRGFTGELLRRMDIESIRSDGYSFAVESLGQVSKVTDKLVEFPIHFENRAAGSSKISKDEIYKAARTIQRLGFARVFSGTPSAVSLSESPRPPPERCRVCGSTYHLELYPERHDARDDERRDLSPYSCATHSSRSHGAILRCLRCGLVFMRPRLSPEALVSEYEGAEDPVYLQHIQARETTFRYNLAKVRKHLRETDKILEIGSYCGAFLKVARDDGLDIVGVEPSLWAVRASADVTDARVYCGTVDDLPPDARRFDAVVAWDVLEHFGDPMAELRKINALLPDGGAFLFSTLMIDNWFPRIMGRHYPWLMDMHLFYFTEETIRRVLRDTGFEVIDDGKYCHVVTLEYLLGKLGTLGVPLAKGLSELAGRAPIGRSEIPFRFGDVKLFVCRKVGETHARAQGRGPRRT